MQLKYKDTNRLKVQGCKKMYHASTSQESWTDFINVKVDFYIIEYDHGQFS